MRILLASLALLFVISLPAGAQLSAQQRVQIVNGLPTSDFPSVGLLYSNAGSCSAIFIGCRTVLTAAHCVCFDSGSGPQCPDGTALANPDDLFLFHPNAGYFFPLRVRVAPDFEFADDDDIAVLELGTPVRGVRPAAINTLAKPGSATPATIVGFGRDGEDATDGGIKRLGTVTTQTCNGVPNANHVCWRFEPPIGAPGSNSGICSGDSGGPMFVDFGEGPVVAGVHSGTFGCDPATQNFDSDVFSNRAWIQSELAADQANDTCGDGPQWGDPEVTISNFEGTVVGEARHSFLVPEATRVLRIGLNWETGTDFNDLELYVGFDLPPTTTRFDCASTIDGSIPEYCEITDPTPGIWHVLVDLDSGAPAFYQLSATMLPENPAPPELVVGDFVVANFMVAEVTQIARTSGDRSLASTSLRGNGLRPFLTEDVMFEASGSLLVTNVGLPALLRIDPVTGDRTVVSGCADDDCTSQVGAGPELLGPRLIARDNAGRIVLSDRFGITISAIVRVDLATGNRTLLSGCTDVDCTSQRGTGPAMDRVFGVVVAPSGQILVADTLALIRIDPETGDRTVISGCATPDCSVEVGGGTSFGEPTGVAIDANGEILVTDSSDGSNFSAIFRVDPVTGNRTILSGCANESCSSMVGAGTPFGDGLFGIAIEADGDLLVTDSRMDSVFHVDPTTGDRAVVSGCLDPACSTVVGNGTDLIQPLGIAIVPEPEAWLLHAAALGCVGLMRRRSVGRRC